MYSNLISATIALVSHVYLSESRDSLNNDLIDHTVVTDTGVFPYVCAILRKSTYLSAGALIDDSWIITAADSLYLLRESVREVRVRLGSINYKKGGVLIPIQLFEIHPFFSDTKPEYDLALIKLPHPVRLTPNLNPIRIQRKLKEITATHFIVTAWPAPTDKTSDELQTNIVPMETIKRRRILKVSHLHPSDPDQCEEEMEGLDINTTSSLMCLDGSPQVDPCQRDVGAPVVLNGILWGIISSWRPEDCELQPGPTFVSLVAYPDINSWIHANIRGHRWNGQPNKEVVDEEPDEYNNDDDDEDVKAFD